MFDSKCKASPAPVFNSFRWTAISHSLILIVTAFANGQPPQVRVAPDAWNAPAVPFMMPESKPIYDDAMADLTSAQTGMVAIVQAQAANKMATLAPTVFTKVNSALAGLQWRSRFLTELGEPAGVELSRRSAVLLKDWVELANLYRNGRKGQAFNQSVGQKLQSNTKQREAAYLKATQMANQGKVEACEKFVLATYQKWFLDMGLLPNVGPYTKGFAPALAIARPAMTAKRQQAGDAALVKLRQSVMPNITETLAATQRIVEAIQQSGAAMVGETQMNGPQAFDQIARSWKINHWNLTKAESVEMARSGVANRETSELALVRSEHQKLTNGMASALADLIVADTSRATQELLDSYLQSAASLRGDTLPNTLSKVDQALGAMAIKLHGDGVADLNIALNDLLRWRARSADARAQALLNRDYPDAQQSIIAAAGSQQALSGIISPTTSPDNLPRFLGCAPEIVTLGKAAGKKISFEFVAPSPANAAVRISRLNQRVFATTPPTWNAAESLAQLKSDLIVTDQHPPLTLNATSSIHSVNSGAFRRCGGVVKSAYPKSLIQSKFALPAASWNMIPLGAMETENTSDYLPQAVMHVDVTPEWFQHEHFLAPAKATAGG